MTSQKQIDANRRNAKYSTGPRTEEGKQRSRANAIQHGLLAETIVVHDEDPELFNWLRDNLIEEFEPEGTLEGLLVDRLASIAWRLRRVPEIEAKVIRAHELEVAHENAKEEYEWQTHRVESAIEHIDAIMPFRDKKDGPLNDDEMARHRLITFGRFMEIKDARDKLNSDDVSLGRAFIRSFTHLDTIGKLSRYERDLVRMFNQTLAELERAKAKAQKKAGKAQIIEMTASSESS